MPFIINLLTSLGTGIYWVVKKFFPALIKKFGLASVIYGIQFSVSSLIFIVTFAFWGGFVVFVTETYSQFKAFLDLIVNPATSSAATGQGQDYLACFMLLMDSSGMSNGISSAFSFTIMILLFMFSHILYRTALGVLDLVSNEIAKLIKAGIL
ncbi:MAG: hypothetical protein WC390_10855 [Sulfurimonas sp.]|jgi:hypothetical protein